MMEEAYTAVYIRLDQEEGSSRAEDMEWVQAICNPLYLNFEEVPDPSIQREHEKQSISLVNPLDRRTNQLLEEKEDSLHRHQETFTDYIDSDGTLIAREYLAENGRLFLSRYGTIEQLAEQAGIEYDSLE